MKTIFLVASPFNNFEHNFLEQRCVRLGKFDTERTITFIPPDGEFELMRYRVTAPSQPFTLRPTITEEGKTKLSVTLTVSGILNHPHDFSHIEHGLTLLHFVRYPQQHLHSIDMHDPIPQITADFPDDKKAKNVVIKIPMPPTAAAAHSKASKGRARYEPGERALVWRISNFQGMQVMRFPLHKILKWSCFV